MANSIALAEKFQPILDEVYKVASLTARMDALTKPVSFGGVATVQVFKTSMVGLGTYSRATGYVAGDVTGTWEDLVLAASRGREFNIDNMDDEETLGQAFGTLAGEFIRTQVAPEVDAYRFAKYATGAGHTATPATLTSSTVLAAVDAAKLVLSEHEVPEEGRLLYVSSTVAGMIQAAVTRMLGNENSVDRRVLSLDGITVIPVPQTRFYTAISLDDGSESNEGGYASNGDDVNFLLLHPSAVLQATKLAKLKVFTPDVNQDMDAYKFQYRLYHDAFIWENKSDGIYCHNKA